MTATPASPPRRFRRRLRQPERPRDFPAALIEVIGAVYAVWTAILAWRRGEASIPYRLAASLVALALVILAGLILGFHVLTPSLAY